MKKTFIILILLGLLSILVSFSLIYFLSSGEVVHVQDIPVSAEVVETYILGMNTDTDALKFGSVGKLNKVTRSFNVVNSFDFKINVGINLFGDIKDFMSISEDNLGLSTNETRKISVIANPLEDSEFGNYTGIVRIVMTRKRF